MSEWADISTAPKDGTRILLWSSGTGIWPICGNWCENYWGFDARRLGMPSHWQPLPDPPDALFDAALNVKG